MANHTAATAESTPKPAPRGLLARLAGIVFSPKDTFAAVVADPRWLAMLILIIVVTAVVTGGFMMTQTGQQAWLDMMEKQGRGQPMEVFERIAPYVGYITMAYIVVLSPIITLIIAGILFAVFTMATGGGATFKQAFSVIVHSQVIGLVGAIIKLPLNYASRSMTAGTNLGVFFPMLDDTSFLARLFGMVDLFLIWWVAVLAIGFGVLYKRKTGPIAVAFFIVYALIAVGIAAIQAARS